MKKTLKYIILFLIQLIEKWEYRHLSLDEKDNSKKIIESIPIENLEIETDSGFKPISHIHKTQPYTIWRIELENGMWLEGADNHIVFNKLMQEVFIKNLKIGDEIQTKNGLSKIIKIKKFKHKISMFDATVNSSDHRFYSNGILSHNTTTISAFFAWYLCFHTDRNMLILANKQATTTEIVSKVVNVFRGLPFFLKPGIIQIGALGLRLDNGCTLTSQATTKTAAIGFTIHVLYIDEFAHINQKLARSFWRSVYPTLSSSKISQCIISSTPDGVDNLFFEIWDKANKGKNSFKFKRVDYWEVPGHDDAWAKQQKADFGEEEFAQEYELSFDRKSNLLLSGSDLAWIRRLSTKYKYYELEKTNLDELIYRDLLKWHPKFDPNGDIDPQLIRFVLSNDIADGKDSDEEGKDNDYNITTIWAVEPKSIAKIRKLRKDERIIKNLFRLRQIGIFRDNIGDEDVMAKVNKAIVFDQFPKETSKWVIEMNFNGKAYLNKLMEHDDYSEDMVMRSYHTAPVPGEKLPRKKAGFKVTSNKEYFCKLGKKLISQKTIIPNEKETLAEFGSFGKSKNSYKGIGKHDDIAMSTLNLSRLYEEPEYNDWLYDFLEQMPASALKNYIFQILQEPIDSEAEVTDDQFKAFYEQTDTTNEQEEIRKIWISHEKNNGGSGRGSQSGLPWRMG
jgi:hypothetical protein